MATIQALPRDASAKLYFRRAGSQTFASVSFSPDVTGNDRYVALLPRDVLPLEPRLYEVEYYVEVTDGGGTRLAGQGDSFAPLVFRVLGQPEQSSRAWYQNPWICAGLAAVVIGAGVGIAVIASAKPTGTLTVRIQMN
jgi:hypothetical protein